MALDSLPDRADKACPRNQASRARDYPVAKCPEASPPVARTQGRRLALGNHPEIHHQVTNRRVAAIKRPDKAAHAEREPKAVIRRIDFNGD